MPFRSNVEVLLPDSFVCHNIRGILSPMSSSSLTRNQDTANGSIGLALAEYHLQVYPTHLHSIVVPKHPSLFTPNKFDVSPILYISSLAYVFSPVDSVFCHRNLIQQRFFSITATLKPINPESPQSTAITYISRNDRLLTSAKVNKCMVLHRQECSRKSSHIDQCATVEAPRHESDPRLTFWPIREQSLYFHL
uniref:Uncharacterized protein n=1 Tax=Hyaloperonospora arabidopsidis (strain Emoy2) TaxID=559515 RepID=M4B7W5_HYAAE